MRTMLTVTMSVEAGNRAIKDGTLPKLIQQTVEELHPEATYFAATGGNRTAYFVFDLKESSQIPAIAEPFFMHLGANVTLQPTMNADDLRTGLERAAKKR